MYKIIIFSIASLLVNHSLNAIDQDSLKIYKTQTLEISAHKVIPAHDINSYGTGFDSEIFTKNGSALIRRGLNFTQDVYSEGFKRGDIKVTIDGEHYHAACPNRMDSPASRVNPLEMQSVEISKTSTGQGAGLYGNINYNRKQSPEDFNIGAFVTTSAISQHEYDASIRLGYLKNSLVIRYSLGSPFLNGEGKTFKDLYGYKDNYNYQNLSISLRGNASKIGYGVSFSNLQDLSFPYLQMDESN